LAYRSSPHSMSKSYFSFRNEKFSNSKDLTVKHQPSFEYNHFAKKLIEIKS
jgi:hypothetical protein